MRVRRFGPQSLSLSVSRRLSDRYRRSSCVYLANRSMNAPASLAENEKSGTGKRLITTIPQVKSKASGSLSFQVLPYPIAFSLFPLLFLVGAHIDDRSADRSAMIVVQDTHISGPSNRPARTHTAACFEMCPNSVHWMHRAFQRNAQETRRWQADLICTTHSHPLALSPGFTNLIKFQFLLRSIIEAHCCHRFRRRFAGGLEVNFPFFES